MNEYEEYKKLFAEALEIDVKLVEGLKYQEGGWDSVGHMSLIFALEERYNIEFETEDIVAFDSFEAGINILGKYGVNVSKCC